MNNWTIRWRIVVNFAVILVLMLIMATVAYTRLMRIDDLSRSIETDSVPGLYYSNQITIALIANYALMEEYALKADEAQKQKLRSSILASRDYRKKLVEQYSAIHLSTKEQGLLE